LKHLEIERIRQTRGASLLLFITDRCPVACSHCSVDSRPDSPMISDFELFGELLLGICKHESVKVVGISGGEPFTERRGLALACEALVNSNKRIVIYTSGVWATKVDSEPQWIIEILKSCSTVYLSTDSFHQNRVPVVHFQRAALEIVKAGAWLVVQTLEVEKTTSLLEMVFGVDFSGCAEVVGISPLQNGRGQNVFDLKGHQPASAMGTCSLAVTPVIRYDGNISSCCNEDIIMGKGPARFRSKVQNALELRRTLIQFKHDPVMKSVAQVGLGQILIHPKLDTLNKRKYLNNCELCWKVMEKFPDLPETDRLIHAIAELGEPNE
jgi:hypothetical protein